MVEKLKTETELFTVGTLSNESKVVGMQAVTVFDYGVTNLPVGFTYGILLSFNVISDKSNIDMIQLLIGMGEDLKGNIKARSRVNNEWTDWV